MASDAQQWLQQAHSELGNMDVRFFFRFSAACRLSVADHCQCRLSFPRSALTPETVPPLRTRPSASCATWRSGLLARTGCALMLFTYLCLGASADLFITAKPSNGAVASLLALLGTASLVTPTLSLLVAATPSMFLASATPGRLVFLSVSGYRTAPSLTTFLCSGASKRAQLFHPSQ